MSEMDPILPPSLNAALTQFYSEPQPDAIFADRLGAQLRQRQAEMRLSRQKSDFSFSNTKGTFMQTFRAHPVLVILAVILALMVLTGMVYAAGRLTGFIPGIGFVQDVQSILETPVVVRRDIVNTPTVGPSGQANPTQGDSNPTPGTTITIVSSDTSLSPVSIQERKGVIITIERVVAEASRLAISYKITGLPADLLNPRRVSTVPASSEAQPVELMQELVRLPDGSLLKRGAGGHCGGASDSSASWLNCQSIYSPLPEGVNQFTFEIHRLQNAFPGELPEDWSIPIQLTSIPATQASNGIQEPNLRSQTLGGITLRLDKVVQSPAQTAIKFAIEWQGANRIVQQTAPITLQDAQGRYYILGGGPEGGVYKIDNPNFSTLPSLVTAPVDGSSPLTFRMEWAALSISTRGGSANGDASILKFDPGNAARVGQEWMLDQTFRVGELDLHFTKTRLKAAQDGAVTLEFDIQAPAGVTGIHLFPKDASSGTLESGFDSARGVMVSRVTLPTLPTRPVELYISEIIYKVNGPWEITWQPQRVNDSFPTPTPAPTRLAPPTRTLNPNEPLLVEAQALVSKAPTPTGPGWVHQFIQTDQAADTGILYTGNLPEQPLKMSIDTWFLLDEQGIVRTTLSIRKTMDGKFISADVANGVYHFSFPEGRGNMSQDIYLAKPAFYWDPLSTINGYVAEGGKVSQESSLVDGKACRQYLGTRSYDPPMIFDGEPAPVRTMVYSVCIDPITGEVLETQGQMVYTDGTKRVNFTNRFKTLEKVENLPEEARQWLEKIVMP